MEKEVRGQSGDMVSSTGSRMQMFSWEMQLSRWNNKTQVQMLL